MSTRAVTFLGTASQVPTRQRNHHALFLLFDELGILFDPGEGTQRQMLLAGHSASQITHIAITHFHGDHCLGLAGIIQRLSLDRVERPVEVLYPASGGAFFERLRHASAFYEFTPLIPRPVRALPGQEVEVCRAGHVRILARALEHGIDCQGYRVQEDDGRRMLPDRLEAAGVRGPAVRVLQQQGVLDIDGRTARLEDVSEHRPGQRVAVVMDTRLCEGAEELARGADLVVCESTYQQAEEGEAHEHYHLTAAGAARLARKAGGRRLALTHFSQRYSSLEGFQAEAEPIFPGVFVADDLSHLDLPPRHKPPSE